MLETDRISSDLTVTRVPGGFIFLFESDYDQNDGQSKTSCFVPLSEAEKDPLYINDKG